MTQKLSKEISKKCGIKPLELSGCSFINLTNYGLEIGTDVCEAVENANLTCEKCKYSKKIIKLFPDFGNTSNFFKLYNLQISKESLCFLLHSYERITNTKEFLEALNRILQGETKIVKQIKETMRNERWLV